ncbi:hypothetical protein [Parabacteroides sp. AM08-6]|uniref:hypothetical protein n=1 Tax=Parabacteroides sp. AM08-6 TaxID=2292053 RepID=UPI0011C44D79|nr:hypothetical protein [Parabacteroides sp. AM08-6]
MCESLNLNAIMFGGRIPNTEMMLVSDVDLDLRNELHTYGSVRNLKDRHHDLYEVRLKRK